MYTNNAIGQRGKAKYKAKHLCTYPETAENKHYFGMSTFINLRKVPQLRDFRNIPGTKQYFPIIAL